MALLKGVNSYSNVAEADAYFEDDIRFNTWDALTEAVKERALVTGSRQISLQVVAECKLPLDEADITPSLMNASFEFAIAIITNPDIVTQDSTGSNLKRAKAGSAEVEFFQPQTGTRFPTNVHRILVDGGCFAGAGTSSAGQGAESFGTDAQSQFTDPEEYNRTRGFF